MSLEDFNNWSSLTESEKSALRTEVADIIRAYYDADPSDCMETMEKAGVVPDPRSGGD